MAAARDPRPGRTLRRTRAHPWRLPPRVHIAQRDAVLSQAAAAAALAPADPGEARTRDRDQEAGVAATDGRRDQRAGQTRPEEHTDHLGLSDPRLVEDRLWAFHREAGVEPQPGRGSPAPLG